MANKTASLLIIGNEILSGKTQDKNLNYIAKKLSFLGVRFSEARIVPDIEEEIIFSLNELRNKFDYVFTTGGIGPTHDDITTECVSKAFNVEMICHPEARKLLEDYYTDRKDALNDARLRMANTPKGAKLIENPLTAAPGYKIENVFVLAGIPNIMQMMFDYASQFLEGGEKISSRSISCDLIEGDIAEGLGKVQKHFPQTEIGSYPMVRDGKYAVTLVVRTTQTEAMNNAAETIIKLIAEKGGTVTSDKTE